MAMLKRLHILLIVFSFSFLSLSARNGLTYERNAGRLGDSLLNYAKHLYIAEKCNLDLYIIPFTYAEHFMLDQIEQKINETIRRNHKKSIKIKKDTQIKQSDSNILYIGSYYTTIDNISDLDLWHHHIYKCSIEDYSFGQRVRAGMAPKKMLPFTLPQDKLSVAVHVRKGGGFDHPILSQQYETDNPKTHTGIFSDKHAPFKFPPEQYYADQITLLHKLLDEQSMYVYVFTDDKEPEKIVHRLKKKINHPNVIFDYRKEGNSHDKNVMEDICAMSQFDYLIRSGSHFPWIAQMIGNHKAIIYPKTMRWKGQFLQVTSIDIIFPNKRERTLVTKTIPLIKE